MDSTRKPSALHLVTDEEPRDPPTGLSREEYWAQVQALRADLARLRPAN
jgi:hypothetical protein